MRVGGPQDGLGGHFFNGCWVATTSTSTIAINSQGGVGCTGHAATNCSCVFFTCTLKVWNLTWVSNSHSTWTGCVMDRKQNYDIANTTPGAANTLFPAENTVYCGSATITPLGYNWVNLSSQISAMTSYGSTNQALGVAHGWQTLTPGTPYGAPAVPSNTTRYMIVLSDGLNTQDRWWGDSATEGTTADGYIDAREKATCDAAKADGIVIYAIYVNVGNVGGAGNSAPLQNCASDATKYYALTTTNSVVTTFQQIAQQITNLRVVK
jgi:hypothetical protein